MINFKKNIFKKEQQAKEEKTSLNTKMLAVWGSTASGKTIISVKIAKLLASKKKNVCLVLCDTTLPILPCLTNEFENKCSIGSILSSTNISETLIKKNLTTLKKSDFLAVLGLLKNENEYTYADFSEEQILEMYSILKNIFDYVIVDCSSYISSNLLSVLALKEANNILKIANQHTKSISYFLSQEQLLKSNNIDIDNSVKLLNNYKNSVVEIFKNCDYKFSYVLELEKQFEEKRLLENLSGSKESLIFSKELEKMCKELF